MGQVEGEEAPAVGVVGVAPPTLAAVHHLASSQAAAAHRRPRGEGVRKAGTC